MSEEEKEAIKTIRYLKDLKWYTHAFDNGTEVLTEEEKQDIDIVLNLLEKQQEKIKELTAFYNSFESGEIVNYPIFKQRYISKDKIREKIKEKQDRINKLHPASDIVIIDDLENQIDCYKELLKENNND